MTDWRRDIDGHEGRLGVRSRTTRESDGADAEQRDEQIPDVHHWTDGGSVAAGERASAHVPTGSQVINTWTKKQLELSQRSCDGVYTCVRIKGLRLVFGLGPGFACEKFHKR